jgi:hypothetical protein
MRVGRWGGRVVANTIRLVDQFLPRWNYTAIPELQVI